MARRRFDTSGELLTRLALAAGVTGVAIVMLAPLVSPVPPAEDPIGLSPRADERVALAERDGAGVVVISAGLAVLAGAPLLFRRSGGFKLSQRLSATGLVIGVLFSVTSVGIFHALSAALAVWAASRKERDPFR